MFHHGLLFRLVGTGSVRALTQDETALFDRITHDRNIDLLRTESILTGGARAEF